MEESLEYEVREQDWLEKLTHPHPAVRWMAAVMLGECRSLLSVDALILALRDEDPSVRRRAAEALGKIGAVSAIPPLIALLASPDGLLRQCARDALIEIGEPAVPELVTALGTPDDQLRWGVVKALSRISSPEVVPAMLAELEDRNGVIRWLAAKALSRMDELGLVLVLGALIRRSDSERLRDGARHVLQAMAKGDWREILEPVLAALNDVDPVVETRIAANVALAALAQMPASPAGDQLQIGV